MSDAPDVRNGGEGRSLGLKFILNSACKGGKSNIGPLPFSGNRNFSQYWKTQVYTDDAFLAL